MRLLAMVMAAAVFAEGAWSGLGGSAAGGGVSNTPGVTSMSGTVAVDPLGRPVVAWAEVAGANFEVYVKRWNGSLWEQLNGSATGGGVSNTAGWSAEPALAFDAQGEPIVAWSESLFLGLVADIMVRRWNGTAWAELAGSGSTGGISASGGACSGRPAIRTDASGNPIVAWTQSVAGVGQIYLKRWNGTAWMELDGSATEGGVSGTPDSSTSDMPALAVDAAGNPVVAWRTGPIFTGEIYLKRWDGAAWIEVDGSATGGGVTNSGTWCVSPSLALNAAGDPTVAWQRIEFGNWAICLRRYTGAAWEELDGSATGTGLSASSVSSQNPSLVVSATGDPIVAWTEAVAPSAEEIYLRRWNGTSWTDIAGSATGGGVSATATPSTGPSLVFDAAGGLTLAWTENLGGAPEVYLSQISLSRPTSLTQRQSDGVTPVPSGGGATSGTVVLGGTVTSLGAGETVRLEVEVRPSGVPFTGVPTVQSAFVASGSPASVTVTGLASGGHHWRARARTSLGITSAWLAMGADPDFVVAGATGGNGWIGGSSDKETRSCASSATGGAWAASLAMAAALMGIVRTRAGGQR